MTSAQTSLPNTTGRAVVERMCTSCHGTEMFTGMRMPKERWSLMVDDMVARGAQGSDSDISQVVQYLTENSGTPVNEKTSTGPTVALSPEHSNETAAAAKPSSYNGTAVIQDTHQSVEKTLGLTFERLLSASKEPQNWLTKGGTYSSKHYSSLSQITMANVKDMELKWVWQAFWLGPYENTPLVVDGVLCMTQGDDVVALDARTGRLFWIHPYSPAANAKPCCGRIARGLAILGHTLFIGTVGAHLIAMDTETGRTLWDTEVATTSSGYSISAAPLVVKGQGNIGVAGGECGIRGFIAGFDAHTDKEAWRFHTTAGPGEAGRETWANDSWKQGGGPIWTNGSYDPETNLTIWGTGMPVRTITETFAQGTTSTHAR